MLKFALAVGIAFEWLFGPGVGGLASLPYAAVRTLCATGFSWMVLEALRALYLGAMSLDDTPAPRPSVRR